MAEFRPSASQDEQVALQERKDTHVEPYDMFLAYAHTSRYFFVREVETRLVICRV